jgi:glucosyl-3-phosphoglycerate synthase
MNTITPGSLQDESSKAVDSSMAPAVVLVPMLNLGHAAEILELAAMLARAPGSLSPGSDGASPSPNGQGAGPRIVVLSVVEVPADQPLTMGLEMARSYRALLDFLPAEAEAAGKRVRVDRIVKVARDVAGAILQAAHDERADMILLYWKGSAREPRRRVYGRILDGVLKNPPCSVMLARLERWQGARRVLLPVRGGPAAEQGLDLAMSLSEGLRVPLAVMHNVPRPAASPDDPDLSIVEALGEEPYIMFNERLRRAELAASVPIETILTRRPDPADALLAEARPDDLLIMGMPPHREGETAEGADSVALRVSAEKGPPLLLLQTPEAIDLAGYTRKVRARRSKRHWTDMPFEHWFVEHTYHGDEFKDPEEFLRAKQSAGLTLSIALLTSNDAKAVRSDLTGLKKVLQEMHPIADHIAVIDSGSTDGTAEAAGEMGVEVYQAADILPEQGALHGRGECWWKSLAVLKGDIVVWLDPRARRFHPSTVLSLAGPLLRVPTLQLVKAFGQAEGPESPPERNHHRDDFSPVDMSWGGFVVPRRDADAYSGQVRVQAFRPADLESLTTAQIATLPPRTLVQVLSPSLAGVISPFGRDMAARREAMLSVPVFAGDNFEVGLLLSVAAQYGAGAIAQVELRHTRPSAPPSPGLRTAIDLLQVMSLRLHSPQMRRHAVSIADRLQHELEGRRPARNTAPLFEVRALGPVERPPLNTVLA